MTVHPDSRLGGNESIDCEPTSALEIGFARGVSDRVVFMADGIIVGSGPPAQVIDNLQHTRTRRFLSRVR